MHAGEISQPCKHVSFEAIAEKMPKKVTHVLKVRVDHALSELNQHMETNIGAQPDKITENMDKQKEGHRNE